MIEYIRNIYGDLECVFANRKEPTIQNNIVDVYLTNGLKSKDLFKETTIYNNTSISSINYNYLDF